MHARVDCNSQGAEQAEKDEEERTPSGQTDRKMRMVSPSSQAFATWNAHSAGSSNQRMGPSSAAPLGRTPNLAALPFSKQYSGFPADRFCAWGPRAIQGHICADDSPPTSTHKALRRTQPSARIKGHSR